MYIGIDYYAGALIMKADSRSKILRFRIDDGDKFKDCIRLLQGRTT